MDFPCGDITLASTRVHALREKMPRVYVFADESGNFDFSRNHGASKYFILVTVAVSDCQCGASLLNLRRELAWEGVGLENEFHATTDAQAVRNRVFAAIEPHVLRIDATILEKAKAHPTLRETETRFYKYAWFHHMQYVTPRVVKARDELLVVGASLGTRKTRSAFRSAVEDVMSQVSSTIDHRVASWAAHSEPCLQVADYCAWAIQRKWERGDVRSYDPLSPKIHSEFETFERGNDLYY